jgi:hypothetical protein
MAHQVAQTLTQAVDKLGGNPTHLHSLVDEISRLELDNVVGWRWWWLGIPAVDGLGIHVLVPANKLGSIASRLAQSSNLQVFNVQSLGIPNPEIFTATIHLGPPGSGPISAGGHV